MSLSDEGEGLRADREYAKRVNASKTGYSPGGCSGGSPKGCTKVSIGCLFLCFLPLLGYKLLAVILAPGYLLFQALGFDSIESVYGAWATFPVIVGLLWWCWRKMKGRTPRIMLTRFVASSTRSVKRFFSDID